MATAATEPNSHGENRGKDFGARLKGFYSDVRSEMKKVTAPSWKEVRGTTVVVLVTVAIFGVFFYIVDFLLSQIVDTIINHFSGH